MCFFVLKMSHCALKIEGQISHHIIPSVLDLDKPASTSASHSVGLPVSSAEVSRPGRPHHQVLHVPPGQVHTAEIEEGKQSTCTDFLSCNSRMY